MEIHTDLHTSSKSPPLNSTGGDEKAVMQERDLVMRYSHSRTCNDEGGVRLFGVELTDIMMIMRKSVSMGNLSSYNTVSSQAVAPPSTPENIFESTGEGLANAAAADPHGYVSDGLMLNSGSLRERKKGVPWTEDEHRLFLVGLQKLGKGDWRGISRNFVSSRTPTQVASHAQKYFLRQMNLNKRKRRSSLFDIISSNMVTTSNSDLAMDFNLTSSNLSSRHAAPIIPVEVSSPVNSLGSKLSSISAELCLGHHPQEPHRLEQSQVLPPLSFTSERWLSEGKILRSSAAVAAAFATMSSSLSSSPSSSLCSIDEATALSTDSLRLSIGPPHRLEPSELSLKLEQPVLKHSVSLAVANDSNKTLINAIRVV